LDKQSHLFTTDIHTSKRSAKLLNAVGGDLVTQSQTEKDPVKKMQMLNDAQGYLKQALEIHPNYKLSYLLIGNSAFYLKDYEKAVEMFRQVLKLDSDFQEGKRNLGVALRDWGKQQGEESHNRQSHLLLEEAMISLVDFDICFIIQNGDTQKGHSIFQEKIELAPTNASGYFNSGIAYQHAGDEECPEAFQQAKAPDLTCLN
jgi:tetratricopeptide (TPR) repeat protein